jgi:hypothetical protein
LVEESQSAPHWTAQFQSVGVGLGAIFAGIGGLKIGLDWLYQARLRRKVSSLRKRYPANEIGKSFRLVDVKENPGKWWLLDEMETPKTRQWVRNYETVRDLGWHGESGLPNRILKRELDKYKYDEPINTREL